jgi:hypothetical protein
VDILARIKYLVIRNRISYTRKAQDEMDIDQLTRDEVREAIMNAAVISKTVRSKNPQSGAEVFYVLISSKRSTD